MTNIIVAFPKLEDAKSIKNILVRSGFTVVGICTSGAQALSLADNLGCGVVVSGYRLSDMIYLQLKEALPTGFEMLLITTPVHQEECRGHGVISLSMPIRVHDITNTMEMLLSGLVRRRKKQKTGPKQRSEEERRVIDEAKAVLMEKNNMTESEAHRYIQKNSMDSGTDMVEYAKMVLKIMYRDM